MTISKLELIFLSLLIVLGSFFRLYQLKETAMFLGDQGRDAIIAKDILKNGDVALIGPVTSVGNMYLGPFYYYFMVPWLWLTYPDPIGPAIGVALLGIATIPMVFFFARKLFGSASSWIATGLFTCSSIIIDQVRFSWNPNIAPTVGLLIFYLTYRLISEKKYSLIIWLSVWFSILIQLHYMALLVGVFIVLPIIYLFWNNKDNRGVVIKMSVIGLIIFLLSLAPLVLFDLRHDHLISQSFLGFFTSNQEHLLPTNKLVKIMANFSGNLYKLMPSMLGATTQSILLGLSSAIIGFTLLIYRFSSKIQKQALALGGFWIIVASILMSFYSSSIFIHYLSFSQGVSLVLIGGVLGLVYERSQRWSKAIIALVIAGFMMISPSHSSAFVKGKSNIDVAQRTSQSIVERIDKDEKYNIVLISGTGDIDAQSYRYFLETSSKPPVKKEQRGEVSTLFIIQEDYFDTKVTDSPIYEIVVFPDKTPKEVYTINNGPTITKLTK